MSRRRAASPIGRPRGSTRAEMPALRSPWPRPTRGVPRKPSRAKGTSSWAPSASARSTRSISFTSASWPPPSTAATRRTISRPWRAPWGSSSTEGGMTRLKGKVALITGGSSGIGEATTRLFVEEGAAVVVADIQDDRGQRLVKEFGSRASYVHVDVAREADVQAAIEGVVIKHGWLDCLFNNAGYGGVRGGIEEIPVAGFDETMAALLRGVFLGMKHAAPVMKRQGRGSIISTASVAGLRAGWGHVYSTAKAAV